jgi:glutathione S-transferase
MLKLYSSGISPFSARVSMVLRAKGVAFEDLGAPEVHWGELGRKSPEFLAINPMGKVPVLVLEDGTPLAESETIITYLDEAYPQPPLQPADPVERARMRNAIRMCESYVAVIVQQTFPMLAPADRNEDALTAIFTQLDRGLTALERYVPEAGTYLVGGKLSLADIVVFTTLYVAKIIPMVFGRPDLVGKHPKITGWFDRVQADPLIAWGYGELKSASQQPAH